MGQGRGFPVDGLGAVATVAVGRLGHGFSKGSVLRDARTLRGLVVPSDRQPGLEPRGVVELGGRESGRRWRGPTREGARAEEHLRRERLGAAPTLIGPQRWHLNVVGHTTVRTHQAQVLSARVEPERGSERRGLPGRSIPGGENEQEPARPEAQRRKREGPFAVGERPTREIDARRAGVVEFNPVARLAVRIAQSRLVVAHHLGDEERRSLGLSGVRGGVQECVDGGVTGAVGRAVGRGICRRAVGRGVFRRAVGRVSVQRPVSGVRPRDGCIERIRWRGAIDGVGSPQRPAPHARKEHEAHVSSGGASPHHAVCPAQRIAMRRSGAGRAARCSASVA